MQRKNLKISKLRKNEDKYLHKRYGKRVKSPRTLNPCSCCFKIAGFNSETERPALIIVLVHDVMLYEPWVCVNLVHNRKKNQNNGLK